MNTEPLNPSSVEDIPALLVSLLPGSMDAVVTDNLDGKPCALWLTVQGSRIAWWLPGTDFDSAEFTAACLDLIESLGYEPVQFPIYEDPDTFTNIVGYRCDLHKIDWHTEHEGKTRSEAVARAIIAAVEATR